MKILKNYLLLCFVLLITFSCSEKVEMSEMEFEDNNIISSANKAQSLQAYKDTVYPIVRKNCIECHGDGGSRVNFASSDPQKGHDLLVNSGKVNLSLSSQSRLYLRLKSDRHECWDNCDENAEEMLAAIKSWLANIYKENTGIETGNVYFKDGLRKSSKMVRGSIVLEAEEAVLLNKSGNTIPDNDFLQGRYLVNHNSENNKDSYASGLRYVSGYLPTNHPFEDTPRGNFILGGDNNSLACQSVSEGLSITNNTQGRVLTVEGNRHPDQDGHRPYGVSVRYEYIRPDKRVEYKTLLTSNPSEIEPALLRIEDFFIITGELDDGMYDGNPLGSVNMFMLLPDYKSASEYGRDVRENGSEYSKNFFAPRFGDPATNYFRPKNNELRSNLVTSQKELVYNRVVPGLRSLVLEQDGTPKKPSDVLEMIRNMDFPGKGSRKYQLSQGQSRLALQSLADDYVDFFLSGMTKDNVLDYVVIYSDANSRMVYPNITNNGTGNVDLRVDFVALDNSSIFSSSDVDYRKIATKHYGSTVHKIQRANVCINCHSGAGPGPGHSNPDVDQAYNLAVQHINLVSPLASNFYDRMKNGRHNCGSNAQCDKIADDFANEIAKMNSLVATEYAAALANPTFIHTNLSPSERSPGRIRLPFTVVEAGDYSLWTRTRNDGNFRVRLLDEQGRGIQRCRADDLDCKYPDERGYSDSASCIDWNKPDSDSWEWYTENYDNPSARMVWRIKPGKYTIEIIESEVGNVLPQIDLVAFSKDNLFDPSTNISDEALVQSIDPRELKYDLTEILGEEAYFSVEVDRFGGDSYRFRNPRVIGNKSNVIVSGISVSISDVYSKTNTSYADIDFIAGTEGEPITNSSLLAQEIFGPEQDFFKFSFELIKTSSGAESNIPKEDLTPFNNRECKHLDQFEKTIFPILTQFKLVYRHEDDGDNTYNFYRMPGSGRADATSMQFFTCTSCHNEDHPYFKMTTFFERNQDGSLKTESIKKLCSQALSRVKFDSPATSLLLRGFEGKANHKRLHIVQEATPTKSGNYYTGYQGKTNSVDGYKSVWRGMRFQKYTAADLNLSAYSGSNRAYLEKFEGLYKIYRYNRVNDPAAVDSDGRTSINGDIMVQGDDAGFTTSVNIDGVSNHIYPEDNTRNKYYVFDPRSELSKSAEDRFNPARTVSTDMNANNNKILMADGCQNTRMAIVDGVTRDPCFGNADADKEFDEVKNSYRDVILNWINREKASGGY